MKKMIFALVAMVMMTMSMNAQSVNDNRPMTFDRMSSYLELRINQVEPVKTAMAQFDSMMEALYQLKDASKGLETWERIQATHKNSMKKDSRREAVRQVGEDARTDCQEPCRPHHRTADSQQIVQTK